MNYLQIPRHLYRSKLTGLEVLIYSDVWTMTKSGRQYWRSNSSIAKRFAHDRRSVIRAIRRLELRGFLKCDFTENGRYMEALEPVESSDTDATSDTYATSDTNGRGGDANATGGVTQMVASSDTDATLIENKKKKKKEENTELERLVFPFDSDGFKTAWKRWKRYSRNEYRNYYNDPQTEQSTLKLISNECTYDTEAIDAIDTAISKGWKGLVFDSSDGRGFKPSRSGGIETSDNRAKLEEYIRTGRITTDRRNVL